MAEVAALREELAALREELAECRQEAAMASGQSSKMPYKCFKYLIAAWVESKGSRRSSIQRLMLNPNLLPVEAMNCQRPTAFIRERAISLKLLS